MAITRTALGTVGSATGSNVTSLAYTLAAAVPKGATIMLIVYLSSTSGTPATATDSAGNSYVTDGSGTTLTTAGQLTGLTADNCNALAIGDTITVTVPTSAIVVLMAEYLTGVTTASYIASSAGTGTANSTAATATSTAASSTESGGLALGFTAFTVASLVTQTLSNTGGLTSNGQSLQVQNATTTAGIFEHLLNPANGQLTDSGTLGTSCRWGVLVLMFRAAQPWYYDAEAGSDFNGGDSYATTANGTDGVGNGTSTFTAASGTFDSTYLGRKINISKSGGNVQGLYTIIAVASATSITLSGTLATNTVYIWNVGGRFRSLKFGGLVGQSSPTTAASGSGFLPAASAPVAGDTLRLKASIDPQDTGITAAWTTNSNVAAPTTASKSITLTSGLTTDIDNGETAWTPSANVTATADTGDGFMQGTKNARISVGAAFTTGLAAFFATGTLNLATKQQVSFWIKSTVAIAAGQYSLRLCSDPAGVTTVNTIAIPAVPTVGVWQPIVVDTAGALGSSIQSVALYVDSDQGAVIINLDNIFASPASGGVTALTLHSLVGKNTGPEPFWWPVKSISGTTVTLDAGLGQSIANLRGYYGVSETVELWKREPIVATVMATSALTEYTSLVAGSVTNASPVPLTIAGGWDRTNMSSQSGQTWVTWSNGVPAGGFLAGGANQYWDFLGAVRCATGLSNNANILTAGSLYACGNATTGMNLNTGNGNFVTYYWGIANSVGLISTGAASYHGTVICHSNTSNGTSSLGGVGSIIGTLTACNNGAAGATVASADVLVVTCGDLKNNNSVGFAFSSTGGICTLRGAPSFSGNTTASVSCSAPGKLIIENMATTDATDHATPAVGGGAAFQYDRYNGVNTDYRQYLANGTILSDAVTRHTGSGISWSMSPASIATVNANNPLRMKIGSVAVASGSPVSYTAYMQRDHVGLTMQLCCPGGQLPGVASDVVDTCTAAINTWEQRTISFTPTAAGVLDIYAQCYGGVGVFKGWVDDVAAVQA